MLATLHPVVLKNQERIISNLRIQAFKANLSSLYHFSKVITEFSWIAFQESLVPKTSKINTEWGRLGLGQRL